MPINLDAIPNKMSGPKRPVTRRWLIFFAGWMVAGALICLWNWQGEKGGAQFWFLFLALPFASGLFLFALRRLAYKCEQVWVEGWNDERQLVLEQETRKGQRYAGLVAADITSVLRDQQDLLSALQNKKSYVNSQTPRQGAVLIRHSRIQGDEIENCLEDSLHTIAEQLASQVHLLPPGCRCYLALQLNNGQESEQQLELWQSACRKVGLVLPDNLLPLHDPGLAALDRWLDKSQKTPSALLVIAAQLYEQPPAESGEAVLGLLFVSPTLFSQRRQPLALVHRPQSEPAERTALALERALLWGKTSAQQAGGCWMTGSEISHNDAWRGALEAEGMVLKEYQNAWSIDKVTGYAGNVAPWVALLAASEAAGKQSQVQLYACQSAASPLWVGAISPVPESQGNVS